MIAKLTKALLVVALLAAYASLRPGVCEAWSLLHPFSSDEPADAKARNPFSEPCRSRR